MDKTANTFNPSQKIWDDKDRRAMKGMILSYIKDLIIANKSEVKDIETLAERMFKWAW